ncbi:MAG: hypothetical protein OEZ13_09985 [Spirochaetia bacterium]|nr:hypothetical protein [Spirochaetia bacterium]
MFEAIKTIFQGIWANKYTRIGLFLFIFLLVFGNIIKIRFEIHNVIESFFKEPSFDDPATYKGKLYDFEEDRLAALKAYKKGIEKMLEEIYDIYNYEIPEEIFVKDIDIHDNWQKSLVKDSIEKAYYFFTDLNLFCMPTTEFNTVGTKWQRDEKLKKRRLRNQKGKNYSPFDYAIRTDKIFEIRNFLFELDNEYFLKAAQKKPDARLYLTFRSSLYDALCEPEKKNHFWQKALEYREYLNEKKVYESYLKDQSESEINTEEVARKAAITIRTDPYYPSFLKEFYLSSFSNTSNLDWKLKKSEDLYRSYKDKSYLKSYILSLLEKSRISGVIENKKIFQTLYEIKYPSIESDFDYLYALSETALRAGEYKKSKALIKNIIKNNYYKTRLDLKKVQRLSFMLELKGY